MNNDTQSKSVKVFLSEDVKRFKVASFEEFTVKLSKFAGVDMAGLRWYYLDEEHDWVSFSTAEEWKEAEETHLRPLMKIQARREDESPIRCPWFKNRENSGPRNPHRFHHKNKERKIENLKNRIEKLQAGNKRKNENHQRKIEKFQTRIKLMSEKLKSQREMGQNQRLNLQNRLTNEREKLKLATERIKENMLFKQEKLQQKVEKLQGKISISENSSTSADDGGKKLRKKEKKKKKIQRKLERKERKLEKWELKMAKKAQKGARKNSKGEEGGVVVVPTVPEFSEIVWEGPSEEEMKKLRLIAALGLLDEEKNLKVLRENHGDVQATAKVLLEEDDEEM